LIEDQQKEAILMRDGAAAAIAVDAVEVVAAAVVAVALARGMSLGRD